MLLHATGVAVFASTAYYETYPLMEAVRPLQDHQLIRELFSIDGLYGGRWKFLTIWGETIQLVYYIIALLNDLFGSSTLQSKNVTSLQRLRDTLFIALALPLALLVCSLFWAMYAIDRDLVMPVIFDLFYPLALNHGVHTAPLLLALLEVVTVPHRRPCHFTCLGLLTTLVTAYLAWTMYLALGSGVWVYGVMKVLNWPQRFLFMGANVAYAMALYLLGTRLDAAVWGAEKAAVAAAEGRKQR